MCRTTSLKEKGNNLLVHVYSRLFLVFLGLVPCSKVENSRGQRWPWPLCWSRSGVLSTDGRCTTATRGSALSGQFFDPSPWPRQQQPTADQARLMMYSPTRQRIILVYTIFYLPLFPCFSFSLFLFLFFYSFTRKLSSTYRPTRLSYTIVKKKLTSKQANRFEYCRSSSSMIHT